MATKAYILTEAAIGKTREVAEALTAVPGMENVDAVTGPYDIIATASAGDVNSVGRLVTDHIHPIPGIIKTVTCLSISG